MNLVKAVCTSCGNNLDVSGNTSKVTCEFCGNTFLVSNGIDFATKSDEEIGSIPKLRSNLKRSILADDHKNILEFSKEILRLIPKDDLANYFFAYANYSFGSRRYLFDFFNHTVEIKKDYEQIIEHMMTYGDVRDKALIEGFIRRHSPQRVETYQNRYQQKLIDEENYSSIPRDVFISYRSTEQEVANKILDTLEKDGSSCWISSRNLRPNDNENYWNNIEDAISKSKIFLVVSSSDAMISRDVKRELDIADKLKKDRLEFKIDKAKHTTSFKYFFDGFKWIDASDDMTNALGELKRRVYSILTDTASTFDTKSIKKVDSKEDDSSEFLRKLNRCKVELLGKHYHEAVALSKDALEIDPRNSEAWWLLFLAENQFKTTEELNEYVSRGQSLTKLSELYNKVSFKQYVKFAKKDYSGDTINTKKFEKCLYDQIVAYLNKPTLPEKSKRDYLHAYLPNHILTRWADNFLKKGINTDNEINVLLNDPKRIRELENIFDDLEDVKNHSKYDKSHVKEYYERFLNNYDKILKNREANLQELTNLRENICDEIEELMGKKNFTEAHKKALELFYLDNTTEDKYMYLLLTKVKAKNTIDLYDAIAKQRRTEKRKLMQSIVFERLYRSEKYSQLIDDLVLHLNYKKVPSNKRLLIDVRGEHNEV